MRKELTHAQGIEILKKSLPYPEQIKDIEEAENGLLYFTWRFDRYKVDLVYLGVEMVSNNILYGNDASILMTHLIRVSMITMGLIHYAKSV